MVVSRVADSRQLFFSTLSKRVSDPWIVASGVILGACIIIQFAECDITPCVKIVCCCVVKLRFIIDLIFVLRDADVVGGYFAIL